MGGTRYCRVVIKELSSLKDLVGPAGADAGTVLGRASRSSNPHDEAHILFGAL